MRNLFKQVALQPFGVSAIGRLLTALRRDRCLVLMLHRFAGTDGGVPHGHDPETLRKALATLRASGVQLLDLDEAIAEYTRPEAQHRGRPPAVAWTVDDGYVDFASVGLPVFAEFDCPVTCFVVPEIVDGTRRFWWDRLDWALKQLRGSALTLELAGQPVRILPTDPTDRISWQEPLRERLKLVPPTQREAFLEALAAASGNPFPLVPPAEYATLGWQQLRALERDGVRFGAHTMTHALLNHCEDEEARYEIVTSVQRVRAELRNPSRVFCYPYGRRYEFSPRDGALCGSADVDYAVTAEPGLVHPGFSGDHGEEWRWRIPRFPFDGRPGATMRQLLW